MVEFLNSAFYSLDAGVFRAMHDMAKAAGGILTPFFQVITLIGEKGLIFFVTSIILMLFAKTRKLGICMLGAVACGALLTNVVLKDLVARPRPFESNLEFASYWSYLGKPCEDGFSFPSGHMTAVMAAMTAMFIVCKKKWSWVGIFAVALMGLARVYLIAHYTSDVIAGIIVGAISAVVAYLITALIYKILNKYSNKKFCAFVLNFSVIKAKKNKAEKIQPKLVEETADAEASDKVIKEDNQEQPKEDLSIVQEEPKAEEPLVVKEELKAKQSVKAKEEPKAEQPLESKEEPKKVKKVEAEAPVVEIKEASVDKEDNVTLASDDDDEDYL